MASIRTPLVVLLISLTLLLTAQVAVSVAATYYVAPGGSDTAGGGSSDPWLTLQHAADAMQPGDEVLVADGTYAGFYTTRNGTSAAPIVFRANGSNVVLNSNNASTSDVINIEGQDYNEIYGFTIQNASRAGIRIVEATGNVVRDCTIGPNQTWGIFTVLRP